MAARGRCFLWAIRLLGSKTALEVRGVSQFALVGIENEAWDPPFHKFYFLKGLLLQCN